MILIYGKYKVELDVFGGLYYRLPNFVGRMMLSQPHSLAYSCWVRQSAWQEITNQDMREQVMHAIEDFTNA